MNNITETQVAHIKNLDNLTRASIPPIVGDAQMRHAQKKGISLYRNDPFMRDIATFMEHPENRVFYEKYMNPEGISTLLSILKVYSSISKVLEKSNMEFNAYHKIFLLYSFLKNPNYSRFITKKSIT